MVGKSRWTSASVRMRSRPQINSATRSFVSGSRDCMSGLTDPLHQLEGDPLGPFEKSKSPADVVHLVAEHLDSVGHQMAGGCPDIVDAERKMVIAPLPQIRRMLP